MKKINFNLNTQNRMILLGMVVSTFLIFFIALFLTNKIQEKLSQSYNELAQLLTKTVAIESVELIKNIEDTQKYDTLSYHTNLILNTNDSISFIEFKNDKGKIIYSSKEVEKARAKETKSSVSAPMSIQTPEGVKNIGSVTVGFSGKMIKSVILAAKNSMFFVFALAWLVLSAVAVINTWLLTRELHNLHHGVKKISGGQFGYTLEAKDASGDIKELISAFNDMSKRLHVYEEKNIDQLTLERNKFETVLMSIINGVVVCDNYDNVVLINNSAQKILEVDEAEILNTKIQAYCDADGELCFKEKIEQFKDTPLDIIETKPIEFNINVGKKVIKSIISPMFSKNQDYVGYIIVLLDVTREVEVDKLKSQFISNVSHELRTPVTILRTYVDTLYSHPDDFDETTRKEFIGVINNETIRLQKMVNDVLDFSRLESPEANFAKEECDIAHLVDECAESMKVLANEKNITMAVIKEPDLPLISINRDSIARALNNLISNAIKYSPEGSRVKVRAEIAADSNYVEVSVEDNGMGIPQEHLKKIFDRFYRVENDTHTVKGTGLGLHLVKITIEKHHGGKVFVTSKVNEGSKFGFRLPINPVLEENTEDLV